MPGDDSTPSSNRSELAWLKQATTRSALKRLGIRSSVLAGQLASVVLFAVFWRHGA
jgi:hypothetical protein